MKPNSRLSVNQLIDYGIRLVQENRPDAARRFFEKAIEREPHNTAALLWLAGLSETSAESYRYLVQTLDIDPHNERAHAAIRWNHWREQNEKMRAAGRGSGAVPTDQGGGAPKNDAAARVTPAWLGILAALLVIGCALASIYFGQPLPVSATVAQTNTTIQEVAQLAPNATPPPLATRSVPPTSTPLPTSTPEATATPFATATLPPTQAPSATPTLPPTEVPTATPLPPTDTPEPPTPLAVPPTDVPATSVNPTGSSSERWIDVDLSNQRLVAYEGDTPVYWVTVSTGLPGTPTVTGQYRIYVKYPAQTMSGPGYYLPDVPYVMYFYQGYGIHGTYWHNNFGHPMSHGCVNTPTTDAQWLYNWADVGTLINVHY
jgi:lipoprotein-anchoring transpeptidase ErfK/SrfK